MAALDSGLLATTLGATTARIVKDRALLGSLLEAFAFSKILKQAEWFGKDCAVHDYRGKNQDEVDIVVENPAGEVVCIEVKAAATVGANWRTPAATS